MKTTICGLLGLLFMTGEASSSDTHGAYDNLGIGIESCGTWASDQKEGGIGKLTSGEWVMGFVTAYNMFAWQGENVSGTSDNTGLLAWIDNYCASHPLDNLAHASAALVEELRNRPHP